MLVLTHGRGADEHDLLPLADILDPGRRLVAVLPRGPLRLPPGGAHWYAVHEIGSPDPATFLPTFAAFSGWLDATAEAHGVTPDRTVLAEQQPTLVILNPAYSARGADEAAPRSEFYSALADGTAGYRRVLSYRTHLWFSPLEWEPRFNGRNEDQFSNVTKVNPTIEVYERVDSATRKKP